MNGGGSPKVVHTLGGGLAKGVLGVYNRATRFFGGFTSHLFLESLGYVCVALKRIWPRVVIFRPGFSVLQNYM